jgi:hypothetical protein
MHSTESFDVLIRSHALSIRQGISSLLETTEGASPVLPSRFICDIDFITLNANRQKKNPLNLPRNFYGSYIVN